MTYKVLTTFLLMIFISCKEPHVSKEGISKITVAFSGYGCENGCPFQALSIDNKLTVKYFGGQLSNKKGYFKGTIIQSTWDSIQVRFEKFIIHGIDTNINQKTDQPDVELIIDNFRKGKSRFNINTGKLMKVDLDILNWFMNFESILNLEPTDSTTFETTIQNRLD